ncbi:MAG: hypothetical protein ACRDTA_19975 [Pseudonocardiaceae bacterium]
MIFEVLAADDPTHQIGAMWDCKELLRQVLITRETHPDPPLPVALLRRLRPRPRRHAGDHPG